MNLKQAVPFLMVTDIGHSIEFYVMGLGFELKNEWRPDERIEWCWIEREGVALMLQQYRKGSEPKEKLGIGVSICFICEDALALYSEFQQKGVNPSEPFVGNKMWVTSVKDPDDYKLDFESDTDAPEDTSYSEWVKEKK